MHNITKYKKALIHVQDLEKLYNVLKESIIKLEIHKKYIPAQECLDVLYNNKILVETHLNHQKKIVESKGKE